MFDNYHLSAVTQRVTENVNVREYKAPTDESVKLLNEFTEKALENLVKSFSTSNNTLQTTWAFYDDNLRQERKFLCKFVLNNTTHRLTVDLPSHKFSRPEDMVKELYTEICNKLAQEIMLPLFEEMRKQPI